MPLGEFSIICFEFLGEFLRKSQNEQGRKTGQKLSLRRSEGCLAAARSRTKKATDRTPPGYPSRVPWVVPPSGVPL